MLRFAMPLWQKIGNHRPAMFRGHDEPFDVKKSDQVAEQVAGYVGSWKFIGGQALVMIAWFLINTLPAFVFMRYDAYPFILMNLGMSAEAAFTGPILLIAANVSAIRDHRQWQRMEAMEQTILARLDRQDAMHHQILSNQAVILAWMAQQGASNGLANQSASG